MNAQVDTTITETTAATMLGDLMQVVIDELKAAPDVWQKLSQDKQQDVIERVNQRCESLIRSAVHAIISEGRITITAELEQITSKDEIKAVCKLRRSNPNRHHLLDSVGSPILIIVASSDDFMGGEKPEAEADQADLPLEVEA